MTNTQYLDVEVPAMDPIAGLAAVTQVVIREARNAFAGLWQEFSQWG